MYMGAMLKTHIYQISYQSRVWIYMEAISNLILYCSFSENIFIKTAHFELGLYPGSKKIGL